MRFACCLTSQGDTKNIIRRKQLLFSSFPALTSRHVAVSRGICHSVRPTRTRIRLPSAGADVRTVEGVEVRRAQAVTPLTAQIYFNLAVACWHRPRNRGATTLARYRPSSGSLIVILFGRCCLTCLCLARGKPGTFVPPSVPD